MTHKVSYNRLCFLCMSVLSNRYCQEYIRDKSVQPRIRTVNHILQK